MIRNNRPHYKVYLTASMLGAGFLLCGSVYIYGLNTAAVHSLAIEDLKERVMRVEEDIRGFEMERAAVTIGVSLEKKAEEQNLYSADSIQYVSRDSAVALDR